MEPPKIRWKNLPKQTELRELVLSGRIETDEKISRFEINLPGEVTHKSGQYGEIIYIGKKQKLNENNKFVYNFKLSPGENWFSYAIITESGIEVNENVLIEYKGNLHEEIFNSLVENQMFKFPKEELTDEAVNDIKSSLKEGYFLVHPTNSYSYFVVQSDGEYLVHTKDVFKSEFAHIAKGLKKRGCKIELGDEYKYEKRAEIEPNQFERFTSHWIEINGEKEMIFEGISKNFNYELTFYEKIIEIANRFLISGNREERVHLMGSMDFILLCISTKEDFALLEKICEPLHSHNHNFNIKIR